MIKYNQFCDWYNEHNNMYYVIYLNLLVHILRLRYLKQTELLVSFVKKLNK